VEEGEKEEKRLSMTGGGWCSLGDS
jgi:hypothetical protein